MMFRAGAARWVGQVQLTLLTCDASETGVFCLVDDANVSVSERSNVTVSIPVCCTLIGLQPQRCWPLPGRVARARCTSNFACARPHPHEPVVTTASSSYAAISLTPRIWSPRRARQYKVAPACHQRGPVYVADPDHNSRSSQSVASTQGYRCCAWAVDKTIADAAYLSKRSARSCSCSTVS
jgi:hypothetical protein